MKWYRLDESNLFVGEYEVNYRESADGTVYFCPLCGASTWEWYGEIDQEWDGTPVYGSNLVCSACAIGSEVEIDED
ncbi:MAG: hypothetical protein JNJ61_27145 [Anaerolineae bacterium]|nr:hypothetical protein [Anaerolineae bacterium]